MTEFWDKIDFDKTLYRLRQIKAMREVLKGKQMRLRKYDLR